MPIRPIALTTVLLALAAGIFLAVTGNPLIPASSESIHMYGGVRTESDISRGAREAIDASKDPRIHLVVQFERLLTPNEESDLESRFYIDILEAMPVNAYVVSFPTNRALGILDELKRSTPSSRGVVNIRPSDKLSPALGEPGNLVIPEHAKRLVGGDPAQQEVAAFILHFFSDTTIADWPDIFETIKYGPLYRSARRDPRLSGARRGPLKPQPLIIATDNIVELLENDHVRWVEPVPPDAVDDLAAPPVPAPAAAATPSSGPTIGAREVAGHAGSIGGGKGTLIAQWESCQPRADHDGLKDQPGMVGRIENGNAVPLNCEPPPAGIDEKDPPVAWHATMVAGIMMGASVPDNFPDFYGMASEAKLRAYALEYWWTDLDSNYDDALMEGATISQNSWGDGCEIYTNLSPSFYRWQSALYDKVVSGRDNQGTPSDGSNRMLIITSAGNHGDEESIPSLWGSVRVANSAKNILTIGNVNTQPLSEYSKWAHVSSGRGPTADGRLAPVLSAPGIRLILDASNNPIPSTNNEPPKHGGIRSAYPPDTYKSTWGTSFSAPMVSGAAARLTETYRNTCPADPSPTTLRALLIHTAHDLIEAYSTLGNVKGNNLYLNDDQCNFSITRSDNFMAGLNLGSEFFMQGGLVYKGPDYIYGYGMVQADKASAFAEKSHFLEEEIDRGYKEYRVNVDTTMLTDEDGKLRVTLVWDDPPWSVSSPPDPTHGLLQNDLDLELIDPSGRRYLPWVLNPAEPAEPARQHSIARFLPVTPNLRDQRNTIEQVSIDEPEPGIWKIRVRAGHMVRPPQSFALVSAAINPANACAGLPSQTVEQPLELPDSWLFWLAVLILALLIIALLWLIWKHHQGQSGMQSPWIHIMLALSILAVLAWLIFTGYFRS